MKRIYATAFAVLSLAVCCSAAQPELTPAQQLAQRGITPERYDYHMACPDVQHEQACDTLKLLIAAGADVNCRYSFLNGTQSSALTTAAHDQNVEYLRLLLEAGADPNLKLYDGKTALHIAANSQATPVTLQIIRLLLDAGANPNAQDFYGNTPTRLAISKPAILAILQAAGGDISAPNKDITRDTPSPENTLPEKITREQAAERLHRIITQRHSIKLADAMRAIIASGTDLNVRDKDGNTLLHLPESKVLNIVDLIQAGADINAANNEGATPLMIHARYDKSPMFIQLLEAGADINRRDNNGKTAADYADEKFCKYNYARLHMAAAGKPELGHVTGLLHEMKWDHRYQTYDRSKTEQYLSELRRLLAAGADPNIPDCSGEPFIFQAVNYHYGNTGTQALEEVLKHGGDVHVRDKYGNTPLHSASGNSTKLLLTAGADPNAVNNEGAPVITHVITEIIWRNPNDWQANICMADLTVKHLLAAGANPNAADAQGNTALHYFLQGYDCADIVNELIARGAHVNARNKDGATPLMLGAAQDWSKTLASFLKNHTPDLNARDNRGLTAMHYAAEYAGCSPTTIAEAGGSTGNALEDAVLLNNIAEIERYIAAGGDVNAKGNHGSTLLHWAAACGHKEITSMLLQAGADPNTMDNSGTTPLQLCFYRYYGVIRIHEECVRLLLDAGADPNVKARDRDELLIFSAARHSVVLELMLEKGISPDIKDSEGTPLIFHATSYRDAPGGPIKVLLNAGVDIFAKNAEGEDVFEADLIMEEPIFRTLDKERKKREAQSKKQ